MEKFAVGFYVGGGEYMTYIRLEANSVIKIDYNKILVNEELEIEFGDLVEAIVTE